MRRFPALSILPENASAAEKLTWDLEKAQGWDRFWRRRQFEQIPDSFLLPIARHYRELWKSIGERDANLYLLETVERLSHLAIHPKTSDDDLIGISKRIAEECREIIRLSGKRPYTADWLLRICNRYQIRPPPALARYGNGIRNGPDTHAVTVTDGVLSQGTISRLTDDAWWRRKLRVAHGRILEAEAIRLHRVHRYAGCYVSDATFLRVQQQRQRNQRVLAGLIAENEDGQSLALDELIEHSLANPANRRDELMVRIYGFEQLAKLTGHEAVLLTVTAPSRMHAHLGTSGAPIQTLPQIPLRERRRGTSTNYGAASVRNGSAWDFARMDSGSLKHTMTALLIGISCCSFHRKSCNRWLMLSELTHSLTRQRSQALKSIAFGSRKLTPPRGLRPDTSPSTSPRTSTASASKNQILKPPKAACHSACGRGLQRGEFANSNRSAARLSASGANFDGRPT